MDPRVKPEDDEGAGVSAPDQVIATDTDPSASAAGRSGRAPAW
jgi:hypothetical protein